MTAANVSSRLGFPKVVATEVVVVLAVQSCVIRADSVSVVINPVVEYAVEVWVLPVCIMESVDVVIVEVVVLPSSVV